MKQYCYPTSKKYNSVAMSIDTCLNKDEIDVAGILVDLPNLIPQSEARGRGEVPVSWGVRKKRSVPPIRAVVEEKPQPQPQPRGKTVESTSPSTPLSFYPTESLSDHKSNLKKRTREDLLDEIDGLRETRKLLTRQVENERTRFEKLKSLNLALKDKKLEANSFGFGLRREKSGLGIIGNQNLNLELKLDQQQYYPNTTIFGYQQQQMIINHSIYDSSKAAAAAASGMFQFPQFLSSNGGGGLSVNQAGPHGIPDLNIGLEEAYGLETFQPLDHSRVLVDDRVMCAAEARRRRMIKIKEIKKRQQPQRVR